jgi:hypothetical protein
LVKQVDEEKVRVVTNEMLGGNEIEIPSDAISPVVRRQFELKDFMSGLMPSGYVLDLREYVLPEDQHLVEKAHDIYNMVGVNPPKVMPESLSGIVRLAAQTKYTSTKGDKLIPELSAVKTNIRETCSGSRPKFPKFWYMLPDFKHRHLPDAFVPRINQNTPKVLPNRQPPILIDANFSTLWPKNKLWTPESIASLLNSAWGQACMECVGTPMGGGALKLEATHLRRFPMPNLTKDEIKKLFTETGAEEVNEKSFD